MSSGNFDFRNLRELQRQIEKIQRDRNKFCEKCAKELAARLLAKVKRRTPVSSGELRRNWTVGSIRKNGDIYEIEVINSTDYGSYVEYGHRTINHRGWVPGQFMMTISERELREIAPGIVERELQQWLSGVFHA